MTFQVQYRVQGQTIWIPSGAPVANSPVIITSGLAGGVAYEFEVVALFNNLQYPSNIVVAVVNDMSSGINTFMRLIAIGNISNTVIARNTIYNLNCVSSAATLISSFSTDFSTQFG